MYSNPLQTLKNDLLSARKARDVVAVKTLQSVLTRITNAEAVPTKSSNALPSPGVGSTEAGRRVLTDQEIRDLITQEIKEVRKALKALQSRPNHSYTLELKQELDVLSRYI